MFRQQLDQQADTIQKLKTEIATSKQNEKFVADLVVENVKLTDIKINLTQKLQKQQETLQETEEHKGVQSN